MSDTKSIEFLVDAEPKECLDKAVTYMVGKGYDVESRSETSVTFSRSTFRLGCFDVVVLLLAVFLTLGLALLVFLVYFSMAKLKERVTLVANPTEDGRTLLTVGASADFMASSKLAQYGEGPAAEARKDLEEWIKGQWTIQHYPKATQGSAGEERRKPLGQWQTPPWEN